MTYPDALSYLGQARRFGMKLGLDGMQRIARELGQPHDRLRFIHIAGTNGKGSTAAFCESILRASGFRTGLYTSPHLVSVRERIQIDRVPISEADFGEGMGVVHEAAAKVHPDATFFELMTALALWYFAREKVGWVVWETGLGGRLDATNIVTPQVCIITNIGLDHQQYLGQSLSEIAAEKAGIIKPGVPVVTAVEEIEAAEVIRAKTSGVGARVVVVRRDMKVQVLGLRGTRQIVRIDEHEYPLRLLGSHQAENAACAVAALRSIESNPGRTAVMRGLESTNWPGRFEIISEKPLIVLDGAHNSAAMTTLVETWRAFLAARFDWSAEKIDASTHVVFAAVADKDISEMARLLRPIAKQVSLVRLANERSAEPATLAESFAGLPCTCYESVPEAWRKIAEEPESIILITGSLFLVGEMLARQSGNTEEYRLNERLEKVTVIR